MYLTTARPTGILSPSSATVVCATAPIYTRVSPLPISFQKNGGPLFLAVRMANNFIHSKRLLHTADDVYDR